MTVIVWSTLGVMGLTLVLWLLSLLQLAGRVKEREFRITADRDPEAPTTGRTVSVIIPARDEEGKIGACLDGVLAQTYVDLEVIVLDDSSSDGTVAEATVRAQADPRVRVLPGADRPEGWMGKVWACHVAQRAATGDVLLFVDADVRLEGEAVRQTLAYLDTHELGALSAFGKLTLESFWEWAVQPVIGGLILQNNDPKKVNDPDELDKVMANGQFIMATRAAYDAVGGHESIRGEILDDVSFARRCKEVGVGYHMVYGRELYACRMYASLGEIWRGWTKNLFAGLDYRLGFTLVICLLLFVMNVMPFFVFAASGVALALGASGLWGVLAVAGANIVAMYASYIGGLKAADYRLSHFWTYPLGMMVTLGIFLNSAWRVATHRGVTWKGRTYVSTGSRQ